MVVDQAIPVNVGSPDMIDQLGSVAPGRSIILRVNPGFGHGNSQKTNTGGEQSKHGIWHADLQDCLLRADRYGTALAHANAWAVVKLRQTAHRARYEARWRRIARDLRPLRIADPQRVA